MSQTAITFAFEQWKAQEAAAGKAVVLDEFVLAYVPDLDHTVPISRAETLPPVAQIVHRQAVNKIGLVNDNAVVYSVTMGTELGDFDFNWIGLVNKASGTVAMIVHAPTQRKVANVAGQQGNVLTRSFLMEYNGAATATGITTPAETWQIDFTARLTGIDEMQRLINVDNYGAGAFFNTGYLVAKAGAQFFVTKGTGYIGGIRADLPANRNITVPAAATKVWADVSLQGNITSQWEAVIKITVAPTLANYSQSGFMHYVFAVASIDAAGNITDLRPQGSLTDDALAKHEQSRNHPDATLTAKGFTQLSSATNSDSEVLAATPKAVKTVNDAVLKTAKDLTESNIALPGMTAIAGFDWQNFTFLSGANYLAYSISWINAPDGISYPDTGLTISITVDYISGTTVGLTLTPSTVVASAFNVYHVRLTGNKGVRTFSVRQVWNAAMPVPITGGGTGATTALGALTNLGLTANGIGLPVITGIQNFDFQNFVFTSGANYLVSSVTWINVPDGISYSNGYISITVDYISAGNRVGLTLIPDTTGQANFHVFKVLLVGAAGSRVFTVREEFNSANTAISLPGSLTAVGTLKGSTVTAVGNVASGNGASFLQADGNVYGSVWGGYLSTYLGNMRNTASKDWNGWFRDSATGLLIQWCTGPGVIHETQNVVTNFPIAFPNACFMVYASTKSPDQNWNNDVFYQVANWSNSSAVCMLQRPNGATAGTSVYPQILAIGA
ncbi:phage tail protein [Yersinia enterocolitica]|nr:phage tail protein [Yersinia enterocolitica]ELI7927400.1 phage tail protein [Yersinia enterocolitica]ELI7958025.1 phage tail protein [Yersinia enterocolitica]ELI8139935.1 phage tail protein [Yersinia enterocolitica]ELI8181874.1 phage tail protein [Yersinia enterocolitica]